MLSAEFVAFFLFPKKKWWASLEEKTLQRQDRLQHIWSREVLDMPLSEIGVHLGGRDHTTIMHAHKKVSELLKNDDKFKRRVDIIYNELNLS